MRIGALGSATTRTSTDGRCGSLNRYTYTGSRFGECCGYESLLCPQYWLHSSLPTQAYPSRLTHLPTYSKYGFCSFDPSHCDASLYLVGYGLCSAPSFEPSSSPNTSGTLPAPTSRLLCLASSFLGCAEL